MSKKLNTDLIRQINDAWLDIGIENKYIVNPLDILRTEDPDEFHMRFTWLLMQPEYFSFVCKHILNIELLPMQALMLKEMWNRKFPMLVGSRGVGKATRCVEPILTNDGWVKMGDITYDHKVYSRNGSLCNIVGIYPQGKRQVCRLEFADGRQIDCCEDHLWVMKKGTKEVTISTKDIINEGVRFDCPSGKWAYKYKLPLCEPIKYDNKDLLIDPYILGCMLGDGCMTTATPKIASNDEFIIDQFRDRLDGFKIELDPTNGEYHMSLVKEYGKIENTQAQLNALKNGRKLAPNHTGLIFEEVNYYLAQNDNDALLKSLDVAIKAAPENKILQ